MQDGRILSQKSESTQTIAEEQRLAALASFDVLDTPRDESFDRIAKLIKDVLNVPIAIVSMIDGHRQWYKAWEGLPNNEAERKLTFCQYTIQQDKPIIVPDATLDIRFSSKPHVTGKPHIRSYAGVPLRTKDGHNIGTVCAIDLKPRQFSAAQIGVLTTLAQIAMDELELRQRAATDGLTGVLSRRAFKEAGGKAIAFARRHHLNLSCIEFDLDHFKSINDTYGHAAGDQILAAVARAAQACLRQSDLLGRLGGEEFAVLLPHTDAKGAFEAAEKLRTQIQQLRLSVNTASIGVTASFGMAELTKSIKDMDAFIASADVALYQAKSQGRNRSMVWALPGGAQQSVRRRVLKSGRIIFNNRASTIDCTVRSLAENSAGLDVGNSSGIPLKFILAIKADNFETHCRIVSQTERHIEVEFS